MTKMIKRDTVDLVKSQLLETERPRKEKFTRKEAVAEISSVIKSLLNNGWDFSDITITIKKITDDEMNFRPNDLKKLYDEIGGGLQAQVSGGKKDKKRYTQQTNGNGGIKDDEK